MPGSEIAQLREQIELTCQSFNQALYGLSTVAQHQIIAHKYTCLDEQYEALERLVGEQEATEITYTIYSKVVQ